MYSPKKGNKIRSGCLTLAFSGARKCYITPTYSEIPKTKRGQIQKCVPHLCLLGGPKKGRNATLPFLSEGP